MVKTPAEHMFDNTITTQQDVMRYSNNTRQKVLKILNNTENEIVKEVSNFTPTGPTQHTYQQRRAARLSKKLKNIIGTDYKKIDAVTNADLKDLSVFTAHNTAKMSNAALGTELFDVTLTNRQLKSIADNTFIDGKTIGDWWEKQGQDTYGRVWGEINKVTQTLQVGLTRGESLGEMIKRIKGTANNPGLLNISRRDASSLVRTSTQQVLNDSRRALYESNDDVIKGYIWISTLDTRTSPICRALDAKKFNKGYRPVGHKLRFPGIPAHWQCRSTLLPWLKNAQDILDEGGPKAAAVRIMPSSTRAAMGKPVSGKMTYGKWLKKQPVITQKEMLGPTRYKLWKKHGLSMQDLVHQNGRYMTIKDLRQKYGFETGGIGAEIEAELSPKQIAGLRNKFVIDKKGNNLASKVEQQIAREIDGEWITGNRPFDVFLDNEFIEVKTLLRNTKGMSHQISVEAPAALRKADFVKKYKVRPHTVVIDKTPTSPTYNKIFYRKGLPKNYRIGNMQPVKDFDELEKILRKGSRKVVRKNAVTRMPKQTTTKGAESWAKKNIGADIVDYAGVDIDVANIANQYLHAAHKELGTKITRITFDDALFASKRHSKTIGLAFEDGTIAFNKKMMRSVKSLEKRMVDQFKKNQFSTWSEGHVFRHEIAHQRYFQLGGTEATAARKLPKAMRKELSKSIGRTDLPRWISRRALVNEGEFYAEALARRLSGEVQHTVVDKYVKLMESKLKRMRMKQASKLPQLKKAAIKPKGLGAGLKKGAKSWIDVSDDILFNEGLDGGKDNMFKYLRKSGSKLSNNQMHGKLQGIYRDIGKDANAYFKVLNEISKSGNIDEAISMFVSKSKQVKAGTLKVQALGEKVVPKAKVVKTVPKAKALPKKVAPKKAPAAKKTSFDLKEITNDVIFETGNKGSIEKVLHKKGAKYSTEQIQSKIDDIYSSLNYNEDDMFDVMYELVKSSRPDELIDEFYRNARLIEYEWLDKSKLLTHRPKVVHFKPIKGSLEPVIGAAEVTESQARTLTKLVSKEWDELPDHLKSTISAADSGSVKIIPYNSNSKGRFAKLFDVQAPTGARPSLNMDSLDEHSGMFSIVHQNIVVRVESGIVDFAGRTLATLRHEIGHAVSSIDGDILKAWKRSVKTPKLKRISDYAGTTAEEHFAESFAWFLKDPDKLKFKDKQAYEFMRDVVFRSPAKKP